MFYVNIKGVNMANFSGFKKIFLSFVLICTAFLFAAHNICFADEVTKVQSENEKFREIYDKLPEANFSYIFNLDPYQTEEYTKYMYAPYPLFRTAIRFVFKNTVIEPGYYLLTPREKEGQWYVLFKTNGKVQHIVPVYEKDLVDPMFYKRYVPERKLTFWQNICQKTRNTMGRLFKKQTQRTPPPKSYIDVNEIGTDFWQVILYYGATKYYMIFMR